MTGPGWYRFRVGALDCAIVDDGDLLLPPEILFPPPRRAEWPPLELDAAGRYVCPLACMLVWTGGRLVLLDTGNGTRPGNPWPGGGGLGPALAAGGVGPDDVDVVVLSHAHADHMGGVTRLEGSRLAPAFPRARHVLQRADWDHYTAPERGAPWRYVAEGLRFLADRGLLDLVEGETPVAAGVSLLLTPGHSPGHSVVRVDSNGETALFVGDLVHHRVHFARPDLVRDRDVIPALVPSARQKIARLALDTGALVAVPHEAFPGLGRLVVQGERLAFQPVA